MKIKSIFISSRFWCALSIFVTLFFLKTYPIAIMILIGGISWFFSHDTVRPLKRLPFWVTIGLLVVLVPMFSGTQDSTLWIFCYSHDQLVKMIMMALRGIGVFLLFQVMTVNLNSKRVATLFSGLGIQQFHSIYEMSNRIIPHLRSILSARGTDFRTKWKKERGIKLINNLTIRILQDVIRLAESMDTPKPADIQITSLQLLQNLQKIPFPSLFIIMGDSQSGKSKLLAEFVESARKNALPVDGVISEKHRINSLEWYHNLVRITTNERQQLNTMNEMQTDIQVGRFFFYPKTIQWGCQQILESATSKYLIIDEFGILELRDEGFSPALKKIEANFNGHLILTVRNQLEQHLEEYLKTHLPKINRWKKQIIHL